MNVPPPAGARDFVLLSVSTGWRPWLRNLSPLPGLSGRFGKDAHERWIGAGQTQHSAWADASLSSSSWECSLHGSSSDAARGTVRGPGLCPEPQTVQAGTCAPAPASPGRKSVEAKETSRTSLTAITRSLTKIKTNKPVAQHQRHFAEWQTPIARRMDPLASSPRVCFQAV